MCVGISKWPDGEKERVCVRVGSEWWVVRVWLSEWPDGVRERECVCESG